MKLINTDGLALIGPGSEWISFDEPFRSSAARQIDKKRAADAASVTAPS